MPSSSSKSSNDLSKLPIPYKAIIDNKFLVGEKFARGSYGIITYGRHIFDKVDVAIKWELTTGESDLELEWTVYKELQGVRGIPKVFWYGTHDIFNVLVMELLGPSLNNLLHRCDGKFSLKTTLILGVQIIDLIENVHKKGFIHRDIKPENFVMGRGRSKNTLYLVDFGLSVQYRDNNGKHVARKKTDEWAGTVEFLSMSMHDGYNASRRDDLESIGYTLLYMLCGQLPWERCSDNSGVALDYQDSYFVGKFKKKIPDNTLFCGMPPEVKAYFTHVKRLRFSETPNYTLLKKKLQHLYCRVGYEFDMIYDWAKTEEG